MRYTMRTAILTQSLSRIYRQSRQQAIRKSRAVRVIATLGIVALLSRVGMRVKNVSRRGRADACEYGSRSTREITGT